MGLFDSVFGTGDQESTVETRVNLPGFIEMPLMDELRRLEVIANRPREFFPGQTFAGLTPTQEGALAQREQLLGMSPFIDTAGENLLATARGDFLTPTALTTAAQGQINRLVPGISQSFEAAGRGGSSAQQRAVSEGITNALGDVFNRERQRQLAAAQLAPSFQQARLAPSQELFNIGAIRQNIAQQDINEQMARFNFAQDEELARRSQFLNSLLGAGSLTAGQTQSATSPGVSPIQALTGLGLAGAGIASGLAPLFGSGGVSETGSQLGNAFGGGFGLGTGAGNFWNLLRGSPTTSGGFGGFQGF